MRCLCLLLLFLVAADVGWSYVQFQHTLVPATDAAKEKTIVTRRATFGRFSLQGFNKVARTRELHNCVLPGCTLMGEVLSINQNNVTSYDPETLEMRVRTVKNKKGKKVQQRSVQFSHAPSGGVLIHEEITNRWFMIYQFENPNPGTMYRLWLRLVNDTQISTKLNIPVNLSPFGGLWKPRVAIGTPTNSLLGAEGHPPDGLVFESAKCLQDPKKKGCMADTHPDLFYDVLDFMRYFGRPAEDLRKERKLKLDPANAVPGFKPYRYGYAYELKLHLNDHDRVTDDMHKLYAMGRTGANGISVMQNGFTVYMSGGKGGLFRFIDEVGGYRNGELSAAVITLRNSKGPSHKVTPGTIFDIKWIPLGVGDSDSLEPHVDLSSETKFSDMLDFKESSGGSCPKGFDAAKIGENVECLRIKNADLAAILEPERVGAIKGATMDIFRFSQIATRLDAADFYIGVVDITSGELGISKSKGTTHIEGNACGCVFKVNMDKNFNAVSMEAVSCGQELESNGFDVACSTESVANPRALSFAHQFEQVLVGEDSPYHANNFVWAIDVETKRHVRIFHAPRQGRVTSLSWHQDVIGGNNYIGITIRNPFDVNGWMSYFGSFELEYKQAMAFSDVAVPYDVGPKNLPIGFARVTSGETSTFDGFTSVIRTGMRLRGRKGLVLIGEVLDSKSRAVDGYVEAPVEPRRVESNEVAHTLGFSSFIDSCGTLYAITATDSLPGMSYVIPLEKKKGKIVPESAAIVDWSSWGGLWRSGGGIVTPWTTHMSGEIHEPDGLDFLGYQCITGFSSCFKSQAERSFDDSIRFLRYRNIYIKDLKNKFDSIGKNFNPYNFGYAYEIRINKQGCVNPQKYLTLGRFSHGGISIMPDGKTVYMTDYTSDRAVGGGMFRFVAHKEKDLTAGTLYAAKLKSVGGGSEKFKVDWIKLGKATNDELLKRAKTIRFSHMFDYIPSSKNCRLKQINVKSELMCLRVKPGMEKWAAFFETRRYAALQGATMELANTRGITFDAFSARLYFSFSSISSRDKIMLQDDIEGSSNDLKFPTLSCGCIYAMSMTTSYEVFSMEKFQCGTNLHGDILNNDCSVEHPAGPTDLTHIPGHGQLLVGEDSCYSQTGTTPKCGHVNNALWSVSVDASLEFTRLLTAPQYSTVSSPSWHPNLKGASYLTLTVNEPNNAFGRLSNAEDSSAAFGYIGPIKKAGTPGLREPALVCHNKREKGDQCFTT